VGAAEQGNHHRRLGYLPVRARGTWQSRGPKMRGKRAARSVPPTCSFRGWMLLQLFIFTSLIARILRGKNYEIAFCALCACPFPPTLAAFTTLRVLYSFLCNYACRNFVMALSISSISSRIFSRIFTFNISIFILKTFDEILRTFQFFFFYYRLI